MTSNRVIPPRETAAKLFAYCQQRDFAGCDPYDALNSEYLKRFPVLDQKLVRLCLTQAFKRLPFDLRKIAHVPPTQNPKALALFLRSSLNLLRLGIIDDDGLPAKLCKRLLELRSPNEPYSCWGYSFPWQTRTVLVPRGAPNVVCTIFVADALFDYVEQGGFDDAILSVALSSCDYLTNELYYTEGRDIHSFRYPLPSTRAKVHNANFLAAGLLARAYHYTGDAKYKEIALNTAHFSAAKQKKDGSWMYGEAPTQQWIDNFHTGYNLSGLMAVGEYLETNEFENAVERGFEFYRQHFFRSNGPAGYYHHRTYPIDIHCIAQSILTLLEFRHLDASSVNLAVTVYEWAMQHMWDERAGFFYYRQLRTIKIRTPYMRWSEAWMLRAVSTLAEAVQAERDVLASKDAPVKLAMV